jgi:hypothetical protein
VKRCAEIDAGLDKVATAARRRAWPLGGQNTKSCAIASGWSDQFHGLPHVVDNGELLSGFIETVGATEEQ